jgi:hypothetical protein
MKNGMKKIERDPARVSEEERKLKKKDHSVVWKKRKRTGPRLKWQVNVVKLTMGVVIKSKGCKEKEEKQRKMGRKAGKKNRKKIRRRK